MYKAVKRGVTKFLCVVAENLNSPAKIECIGEFNNARARRALADWYLSLFVMCKA